MPEAPAVNDQPLLKLRAMAASAGLRTILHDVNLDLCAGEVALVAGRNGVGKSTLIATMAGLRRPSGGEVLISGYPAGRLPASLRATIGLMAHRSLLYQDLTALENLVFFADFYGFSDSHSRARRWLARVALENAASVRVRNMSRGMEQRLAIARAFISDPRLLLFDEPFTALDSDGIGMLSAVLREVVRDGAAAVVTAHAHFRIDGIKTNDYELRGGTLVSSSEGHAHLRNVGAQA